MASSSRTDASGVTRKLVRLAIAVVLAGALYTGGWFYAASWLKETLTRQLTASEQGLHSASCNNLSVRGFPFRIGLFCDAVGIDDRASGLSASFGALRSAAQVYRPWHIVGELDGPATVQIPGLNALEIDWSSLGASLRIPSLPERFSLEGKDVQVGIDQQGPAGAPLAQAGNAQLHIRWAGDDLDLGARFTALALSPDLLDGATLPPLSGVVSVTVDDGTWFPNSDMGPLRGKSGTLHELTVTIDAETGATATGPVAIDDDGLVDAEIEVTLRNPQALAGVLAELMPDNRQAIELALGGLSGGGQTATLPLRIAKSQVSIGFLSLGTLPPL